MDRADKSANDDIFENLDDKKSWLTGGNGMTPLARQCLPLDLGYARSVRSLIPTV
jgi:hypothetical protein